MDKRRKRRRRRRHRRSRLNSVLFCVLMLSALLVLSGICRDALGLNSDSASACGVAGHFKGDGMDHHSLKVDCGAGHVYACQCNSWVVPMGGTYYTGVTSSYLGDYGSAKEIYSGDRRLPCGKGPQFGDVLVYGDYEYRYACKFDNAWVPQETQKGWGVRVLDHSKSSYGELLSSINNSNVVNLSNTFAGCSSLETPPKLPSNATDLTSCFEGCVHLSNAPLVPESTVCVRDMFRNCTNLISAPIFPQSVFDMGGTFYGCSSLTSVPQIPGCVIHLDSTFAGCTSLNVTPDVPITVMYMSYAFADCKRMVSPPSIPLDVIDLEGTFSGCTLLAKAPKIPDGVINLKETFRDCSSLTKAPNIPEDVLNMTRTFDGCISLKGYIVIFAEPQFYQGCLARTQINEILGTTSLKTQFLLTR